MAFFFFCDFSVLHFFVFSFWFKSLTPIRCKLGSAFWILSEKHELYCLNTGRPAALFYLSIRLLYFPNHKKYGGREAALTVNHYRNILYSEFFLVCNCRRIFFGNKFLTLLSKTSPKYTKRGTQTTSLRLYTPRLGNHLPDQLLCHLI